MGGFITLIGGILLIVISQLPDTFKFKKQLKIVTIIIGSLLLIYNYYKEKEEKKYNAEGGEIKTPWLSHEIETSPEVIKYNNEHPEDPVFEMKIGGNSFMKTKSELEQGSKCMMIEDAEPFIFKLKDGHLCSINKSV